MNRFQGSLAVILMAMGGALGAPALAQGSGPLLFFSGDMVVSPPKGSGGAHCVLRSQYKHNEEVVFRVRVLNAAGDPVTDKDLAKLDVKLSSGEVFAMKYGGHPHDKPLDSFWTAGWKVPVGYPDGSMSYSVIATEKDGSTQTWVPFNVAPSQLTILDGTVQGE